MKVIWSQPERTAQDVVASLSTTTHWTSATVKTLLNRLLRKGALHFEKRGKAYFYSAAFPEEAFRKDEAKSFLDRVFDGGISPLVAHFVQSGGISRKQIEELEQILRDAKESK